MLNNGERMLNNVHLDIVNGCNTNCMMCGIYGKDHKCTFVSPEQVKRAEKWFSSAENVRVGCDGETTIHPHLISILEICRSAKKVHILSNGKLISKNSVNESILRFADLLRISFDGGTPETFRAIRGFDGYDMITRSLASLKQAKPELITGFAVTLMLKNLPEFKLLFETAKNIGAEIMDYGHLVVAEWREELFSNSLYFHKELCDNVISECAEIASGQSISFHPRYFDIRRKDEYINPFHSSGLDLRDVNFSFATKAECDIHKTDLWIKNNGSVMICARRAIGNIYDGSADYESIEEKRQKAIDEIESGKEAFCKDCTNCYIRGPRDISSHFTQNIYSRHFDEIAEASG